MKRFWFRCAVILAAGLVAGGGVGCTTAIQQVKWSRMDPLDYDRGAMVTVEAYSEVPAEEVAYLQTTIQEWVSRVMRGDPQRPDAYQIQVNIVEYTTGNAAVRVLSGGLGEMRFGAEILVCEGEPPQVRRRGLLEKRFRVRGVMGGIADMHGSVCTKVGVAVAKALSREGETQ